MKKLTILALTLLLCCSFALAQTVPDAVIRAALLENDPLDAYPTCDMMAEWHMTLGEEAKGQSAQVYVMAHTAAFGEVNGVFLGQHHMAKATVLTFAQDGDDWKLTQLTRVDDDSRDDVLPESAQEAYDDYDEDEAFEAIRKEAKAWLKQAGRSMEIAVTYYDMEDDLDDVELPEDVWQLTVGWPVGYLDQLAACRYTRNGSLVTCTTAWEPDEEDDELGVLTYTMKDEAGQVLETISIAVTEDEAVVSVQDGSGSRRYICTREDDAITGFTMEAEGDCGVDVTALETNLRIAVMQGIEAYN